MIIFSKKERAGNQRRIFHKDTVRQAFWRALPIMGSYLFVTIFVDQWKAAKSHIPALLGLGCGVVLLLIVGPDYFLLPTLILVSGILLAVRGKMSGEVMEDE